jgi:hypothetical protein
MAQTDSDHYQSSVASSNNNRLLIFCQQVTSRLLVIRRLLIPSPIWRHRLVITSIILTGIGIVLRVWLVLNNPLWSDEMYSIWAVRQSWTQIITSTIDVVHPPGYYIFLKTWLIVSDQLQWVRLLSLLAALGSMWLLVKISQHETKKNPNFAPLQYWWPAAYALSGFHLVFDWAVRMYAMVAFWTLLQLYAVRKPFAPVLVWLIAAAGLLIDYGFFWSYVAIWLLAAYQTWQSQRKNDLITLLSLTLGSIPFVIWQLGQAEFFQAGINGILWMQGKLTPDFFVPFFLGTHSYVLLTSATLLIWILAFWKLPATWKHNSLLWWWILASIVLIDFTLIYSAIKQPLLHPRSLQFIGLAVSFGWAVVLSQPKWRLISLATLLCSAFAMLGNFDSNKALQLLIEFYPWSYLRSPINAQLEKNPNLELFVSSASDSPSPMLTEGIVYTFAGKEKLGQAPIPMTQLTERKKDDQCFDLTVTYVNLQACPKQPTH